MKITIFFYKTKQEFPSNDPYQWIEGDRRKIFFSNTQDFNEVSVKTLLPLNPTQGEIYLFLVPQSWREDFETLVRATFSNIDWQVDPYPTKPHKNKVDNNWEPNFGEFYDTLVFEGTIEGKFFEKPKKSTTSSIRLLRTFFPFIIPVFIALSFMILFKPSAKDIIESQRDKMLEIADKGLDQGLELDVEETSYWAGDRILKFDASNEAALRLVNAVKEVETAQTECQQQEPETKSDSPPASPVISEQFKQRKLKTEETIQQEPDLYTLQIARMSTGELNDWLEKLTPKQLINLFVYPQDEQSWKVTYGKFEKMGEKYENSGTEDDIKGIESTIQELCCLSKFFKKGKDGRPIQQHMSSLFGSFPQNSPLKTALEKEAVMEVINGVRAEAIPTSKIGLYIPKEETADIIKFCQFSKLGEC